MPHSSALGLTGAGEVYYNGITFGFAVKTTVTSRPEPTPSGRAVKFIRHRFDIEDWVNNATTTDTEVESLRKKLMAYGGVFRYSQHGWGTTFSVNEGVVKDVDHGPKPIDFRFESIGAPRTARIRFVIEVCVPECDSPIYRFGFTHLEYSVNYEIRKDGATTRNISGEFAIPLTRQVAVGVRFDDHADNYREKLEKMFPIPLNFQRESQSFNETPDKKTLRFTFVDVQLAADALPEGTTDADGQFALRSTPNNLFQYTASISANYTVSREVPRGLVYKAFWELCRERIEFVTKNKGQPIAVSHGMTEELYREKLRTSFELQYIVNGIGISEILEKAGFYRAVPKTNAAQWAKSVEGLYGVRGQAGMSHKTDAVISLCQQGQENMLFNGPKPFKEAQLQNLKAVPPFGMINKELSFIKYEASVRIELVSSGSVRHKGLTTKEAKLEGAGFQAGKKFQSATLKTAGALSKPPGAIIGQNTGPDLTGAGSFVGNVFVFSAPPKPFTGANSSANPTAAGKISNNYQPPPDKIQYRTTQSYAAIFKGVALRAGFDIPMPTVDKVGGVEVHIQDGCYWEHWLVANWQGVPVYQAEWYQIYDLLDYPVKDDINVPPAPALGFG